MEARAPAVPGWRRRVIALFWAYVAGMLTLINPCVLPLVPVVLAASLQATRLGPVMLAVGLTLSFAIVGTSVAAFGHLVGVSADSLNRVAAAMMVAFGAVLLVPRADGVFSRALAPLADGANGRIDRLGEAGHAGQLFIGALLGLVWTPCIGPTLGGAIGLAASGESLGFAGATMLFFGMGVSSVLVLLAYGSREALGRRRERLRRLMPLAKPVMGGTLLVVGLGLLFHVNRAIESWLLDVLPIWLQDLAVSV